MNQTTIFVLFTLIGTILSFAFIVGSRSIETSKKMARGFYILCLFLCLCVVTATILSVSGLLPIRGTFAVVFQILIYRAWFVIGTGVGSAVLILLNSSCLSRSRVTSDAVKSFVGSPYILKGLCLSVSVAFLITEIGKLAHDQEMRQFFLESGYPVWFLYFVIGA